MPTIAFLFYARNLPKFATFSATRTAIGAIVWRFGFIASNNDFAQKICLGKGPISFAVVGRNGIAKR